VSRTTRIDRWWTQPAVTGLGLVVLFGYLTLRAFNATYVWADPYISPVVAPALFTPIAGYPGAVPVSHAWLGAFPAWWPSFIPRTPALFVPWIAIAFRFTCYYYRGAYYKAFFLSPPACAVRGVQQHYRGETRLLIVQQLHRYALYGALFLLACLWWEALAAFFRDGRLGIGVGTAVMIVNATLLTGYTLGCHSWRHLIAGRHDCLSCGAARYQLWKKSSWLNERHMAFAWFSLVWVVLTDVYIYLVSTGTVRDLNTW
jgi:hypothetical protein